MFSIFGLVSLLRKGRDSRCAYCLGAKTREFQCGIALFESKGQEFGADSHASWYVNVSTLSVCCYIDDTEKWFYMHAETHLISRFTLMYFKLKKC